MEQKQFNELSLQELKAVAYDTLAALEFHQTNLKKINSRISELSKQVKTEEVK